VHIDVLLVIRKYSVMLLVCDAIFSSTHNSKHITETQNLTHNSKHILYTYKFSRDVNFADFAVSWPSMNFSSSKTQDDQDRLIGL